MSYEAINLRKKFALFNERWQPKVIAEMNGYQFKVVKLQAISFDTITKIPTRRLRAI